ncbi:hypothetical protein HCH73_08170 [Citrobacter koseri]|uniref:hypothetical protein n=1 Tax=Citrobacter koseri TaxID=545 RepID=UPI0018E1D2FF|nr:hypothetical protein [Citrobacter koseri]MBI0677009.1 hypothetical protein [Citrobacter koseri]
MKLFHGSYSNDAPAIKIGAFAMSGDNIFDGIFACSDSDVAGSHGNFVYSYNVESIADNGDLNDRIADVISFLRSEVEADEEQLEALAYALAGDECDDAFADILSPRTDSADEFAAASWEMQRLRGRAAAHLGFDAVEMEDEHGTSYLIVNSAVKGE